MAHQTDILRVQTIISYQFRNASFILEALQAPGSSINFIAGRSVPDGNRRLALLGDSVIKTALLDAWYPSDNDRSM